MGFGPLDIVVFLVVLGVLVFVHELGHFVAAKLCNIYVDRFSLGMPPRLFGFRYGETDYCVGLLPIGGYVKMAGQEDQPLSDEERQETYGHVPPERWYNNKKPWQRAFVLLAGPAMNLVLALLIYGFVGAYGREVSQSEIETRIGAIEPGSPASEAPLYLTEGDQPPAKDATPDDTGWRTGDRILSIDGEPVESFHDILVAAILGGGKEAFVELERPSADGTTTRYYSRITAEHLSEDEEARRFGVAPYTPAYVRHVFPASPAMQAGLQPDDEFIWADGEPIDQVTFSDMVRELPEGEPITLTLLRGDEEITLDVTTRREGSFKDIGFDPAPRAAFALMDDEPLEVADAGGSFLSKLGLSAGELVSSANGSRAVGSTLRSLLDTDPTERVELSVKPSGGVFGSSGEAHSVTVTVEDAIRALTGVNPETTPTIVGIMPELAEKSGLQRKDRLVEIDGQPATVARLREYERTRIGETVPVVVERPAILFGLYQKEARIETELTIDPIQQIGVVFGPKMVFKREPLSNVIPFAFSESYRQVTQIGAVLSRLFTGQLNPKLLGGPVMIGDIVTTAYRVGFFYLLDITAMISVNLAIFNLLPLPVLDGGQLVFVAIEAIRRRPVNTRIAEAVQQIGFLFIVGLLLFVTFNDVSRIVGRFLP
jgi:regulator of sigma E protease